MTSKREIEKRSKTGWIGFCLSIPAFTVWIWILWEVYQELGMSKDEVAIAILAPVTLGIGVVAYTVHLRVWKWRGAVVVMTFGLHFVAMAVVFLLAMDADASGESFAEILWAVIEFPLDSVRWDIANFDFAKPSMAVVPLLVFGSLCYAAVLHPLYPTFSTAMASSIGFSLYIEISFLMMSRAG